MRLPAATCQFGAVRRGRGRHLLAHDVREIYPAALEDLAVFNQAGDSAATLRPVPDIAQEGPAFHDLELTDDAILQSGEIVPDRADIHPKSQDSGSVIASTFSLWRLRKSMSFFVRARP